MKEAVYCRQLEDGSGFGVFVGTLNKNTLPAFPAPVAGRDRWEECVGVGGTRVAAWADYRAREK
jgi:hypothetical protein